eukprot:gene6420-7448_t
MLQEFVQRLAREIVQRDFLPGRGKRGGQVEFMADTDVERTLAGLFRCLPKGLAGLDVVVHGGAKGGVQFGDGFALVADQGLDEKQLSEQAVVFDAGFDGADVAFFVAGVRLVQGDHCTGVAYVEPDPATRPFDLRVSQAPQQRDEFGQLQLMGCVNDRTAAPSLSVFDVTLDDTVVCAPNPR